MRFAIFADCDLRGPLGLFSFPGLVSAQALSPDAIILAGDFDHRNPKTRPAMEGMHADVAAVLAASGVTAPVLATWSDHDYGNNNASQSLPSKALAIQVWSEKRFMCADNGLPHGIWQRQTYGTLVDVFLLDCRSNRDTRWTSRTMLGALQEAWLIAGLLASTATWKLLVSDVSWNPTVTSDKDSWSGYEESQAALLDFIAANAIRNVIIASGDIHSSGKIDDGQIATLPELSVPRANTECFVASSAPEGNWTLEAPPPYQPGFGLIDFTETEALLEVRAPDGAIRLQLTVPVTP